MSLLTITGISKSYGQMAVNDISFELESGQILCLLGPSGCGKTTLLRIIAGLTAPDSGKIYFNGKNFTDLSPEKRNFGLMFQDFALFPHKNVRENIAYGLKIKNKPPNEISARTNEMLDMTDLNDISERRVSELSGGERQRVALARSLAPEPELLMLDEPMGALDRNLREKLLPQIRTILKRINISSIFVTHDQAEALEIADQILVMNEGRIEQLATPENLYLFPKNEFVAGFLGFRNIISGTIEPDKKIKTLLGVFGIKHKTTDKLNQPVKVIIRPESARLADQISITDNITLINGILSKAAFRGQFYRIKITTETGIDLTFDLPNTSVLPDIGHSVSLAVSHDGVVILEHA